MTMLDPNGFELPPIPSKRYFAIGEVSSLCEVKPHVLRYWEQEFPQLKPAKRNGNRRYYQRHEIKLIRYIRHLLYTEGFTISGARTQIERLTNDNTETVTAAANGRDTGKMISRLLSELIEVQEILS